MNFLVQFAEGNFVQGFLDNVNVALPFRIVEIPENSHRIQTVPSRCDWT